MPKPGERTYFHAIGEQGVLESLHKPFSSEHRGSFLAQIGAVLSVLPEPPARVLDLGCGTGWTSVFLARSGYEVVGQDIADDAIARAEEFARLQGISGLSFVTSDYETLAFEGEFDAAVFFDSLHHSVDERAALRSAFKALRSGGVLVATEPGKGHSRGEQAKQAVARYDVTERDMPPSLVIKAGRSVGFANPRVFPDPALLHRALYRTFPPESGRKVWLNRSFVRVLAAIWLITFQRRRWGLVRLQKP